MDLDYFTEDGHYFSEEDMRAYVIWQIKELKEQNYNDEDIVCFDDNRWWEKLATRFLEDRCC